MQRRNSTRSFKSLQHRKSTSTSSTKSVRLEHILPEMAERDAQAAAMQAFARAKNRNSTDTPWPPPRYSSVLDTNSLGSVRNKVENSSGLRRQQSVRFIHPTPPPAPRTDTAYSDRTPTRSTRGGQSGPTGIVVAPRYENSTFASGAASSVKSTAGDYTNALIMSEEHYTPEDDIASAPSSYRRIRKSRSMLIGSNLSSAAGPPKEHRTLTTSTSGLPRLTKNATLQSDENRPPMGLRAPKSMSFLRSYRNQSMQLTNDTGPAYLRSKPTGERGFKKSLRDVSNGAASISLRVPKDGSLRNKARKASYGLKHKFKSLFAFGKEEADDNAFPPQQAQSHMTRSGETESIAGDVDDVFRIDSPADEGAMSRVTSGLPSLHTVPSYQQLRSQQGSVESLTSDRNASDEKSRVTSWTNSETNTATTANSSGGDWERQRLSVIKENGVHVSSFSARRRPTRVNTCTPSSTNTLPPPPQPQSTINGERVYSALMKRVTGKIKRSQSRDSLNISSVVDVMCPEIVPPSDSWYNVENWRLGTPATIRRVAINNESDCESVETTGTIINTSRVRSSRNNSPTRSVLGKESFQGGEAAIYPGATYSSHEAREDGRPLTASYSEEKQIVPPGSISSRTSAFFGSPMCHLFRTKSPYRRALQGSMRESIKTPQLKSPEFNPWMQSLSNLPLRCPNTGESSVDHKMQYDESVYSCDTESPKHTVSNVVPVGRDSQRPPSPLGNATIFVEPNVYRPSAPIPPSPPKERIPSPDSPLEWKAWLSVNMSRLEGSPPPGENRLQQDATSMSPVSHHIRERTQITDDNDDGPQELDVYKPTRLDSKTPSSEYSQPSTYLPRPLSKTGAEASSSDKENEAPKVPPIPLRNALRTVPSSSSIRSSSARHETKASMLSKHTPLNSTPRRTPTHMRSLNTLQGNQPRERQYPASRLPRKQARPAESPGIAAAVDQQFGAVNSPVNPRPGVATVSHWKSENVSPRVESGKSTGGGAEAEPGAGTGTARPNSETGLGHQELGQGSKKMVEQFLSSRRRRMASSDDRSVFL